MCYTIFNLNTILIKVKLDKRSAKPYLLSYKTFFYVINNNLIPKQGDQFDKKAKQTIKAKSCSI